MKTLILFLLLASTSQARTISVEIPDGDVFTKCFTRSQLQVDSPSYNTYYSRLGELIGENKFGQKVIHTNESGPSRDPQLKLGYDQLKELHYILVKLQRERICPSSSKENKKSNQSKPATETHENNQSNYGFQYGTSF